MSIFLPNLHLFENDFMIMYACVYLKCFLAFFITYVRIGRLATRSKLYLHRKPRTYFIVIWYLVIHIKRMTIQHVFIVISRIVNKIGGILNICFYKNCFHILKHLVKKFKKWTTNIFYERNISKGWSPLIIILITDFFSHIMLFIHDVFNGSLEVNF